MRVIIPFLLCLVFLSHLSAQTIDFENDRSIANLFIKMYGEIQYYQEVDTDTYRPGKLDAKRVVALFGYQFSRNTQFITEWELEHGNEMFVEQAFIKHKLKNNLSLKAGVLLIPMGNINENHEPTNFFSVDRPIIDRNLVPSTWRDIGIGVTGVFPTASLKYQAYLVNGLVGYKEGEGLFQASNTFRGGRQKGIKTILSGMPSFSGQLEYFGLSKTKIGLSIYSGLSNTDAYSGLPKDNSPAVLSADSTVVYSTMTGLHANSVIGQNVVRGQLIYNVNADNVYAYNAKTGSDLGKSQLGAYVEYGRYFDKDQQWMGFLRYSYFDENLINTDLINTWKDHHYFTFGFNYQPVNGALFKIDAILYDFDRPEDRRLFINTGIGVWF